MSTGKKFCQGDIPEGVPNFNDPTARLPGYPGNREHRLRLLGPGVRELLLEQAVGFAGLEIHVHPAEGRVGAGAGHE